MFILRVEVHAREGACEVLGVRVCVTGDGLVATVSVLYVLTLRDVGQG